MDIRVKRIYLAMYWTFFGYERRAVAKEILETLIDGTHGRWTKK